MPSRRSNKNGEMKLETVNARLDVHLAECKLQYEAFNKQLKLLTNVVGWSAGALISAMAFIIYSLVFGHLGHP